MRRLLAIAVWLPFAVGCFAHHRCSVPASALESCHDAPGQCRQQVYAVLLHGFDPCDTDELATLNNTLRDAGFTKTYHGHWYHVGTFAEELIKRHQMEPHAQIVIIGAGLGIESAHELANRLNNADVPIAALMAINPPLWAGKVYTPPSNVGQVVYLQKKGAWSLGASDGVHVVDIEPYEGGVLTTEPEVAQMVLSVMVAQTKAVPHQPRGKEEMAFADPVPTPRPVLVERPKKDDWDFLRPVAKLPPVGDSPSTTRTVAKPAK